MSVGLLIQLVSVSFLSLENQSEHAAEGRTVQFKCSTAAVQGVDRVNPVGQRINALSATILRLYVGAIHSVLSPLADAAMCCFASSTMIVTRIAKLRSRGNKVRHSYNSPAVIPCGYLAGCVHNYSRTCTRTAVNRRKKKQQPVTRTEARETFSITPASARLFR